MTPDEYEIIEEAKRNGEPIAVIFDDDEYTVAWTAYADDGSPTGTTGFAGEDQMQMLEEDFESARWATEDEAAPFIGDAERTAELIAYAQEREQEKAARKRAEARAKRVANRTAVVERYEARFGSGTGQGKTMKAMRAQLDADDRVRAPHIIAHALRGFGF